MLGFPLQTFDYWPYLNLNTTFYFSGNPKLLMILKTPLPLWLMVVVALCCGKDFHQQGQGTKVHHKTIEKSSKITIMEMAQASCPANNAVA